MPVSSDKWSDFRIRLASALVLAPVALAALWYGGLAWALFVGLAMAGLGYEWGKLAQLHRNWWLPFLLTEVWLTAVLLGIAAGFVVVVLLMALTWWRHGRFAAWGMPYAAIGGLSLLWLRLAPAAGLIDTLFVVAVVWGTDVGAYLIGRVVGGRKMAPKISPGKTWSGSVGGLLIGGLCGATLAGSLHGIAWRALPPAFLLSFVAQAGDLLESAIKRKLGVKDSGNTIPGHGGLFDRLDGFLAAAPVAACFAILAPGGLPLWH